MSSNEDTPVFHWHGAFKDKALEDAYWAKTWPEWSKVSIFIALIIGLVLVGLVMPQLDYQLLGFGRDFATLFAVRLCVFGLFFGMIIVATKTREYRDALHQMTLLAMFGMAGMMVVGARYHESEQFFLILAHILPSLTTFLIIPNRPQYKLANGLVFAIVFILTLSSESVMHSSLPVWFLLSSYIVINLVAVFIGAKRDKNLRLQCMQQSQEKKVHDDAINELKRSKLELHNILENLEDTFFRTDPKGTFTYVSPSVERQLGMAKSELLGRNIRDILFDESYLTRAKTILKSEDGHLRSFRSRLKSDSRTVRWIETSAGLRFDSVGTLLGVEGTVRDISDLVKAEEMLRHSQKMEAVGHLTGGVAHDFNNLLAVVSGNVELLWGANKEQRDSIQLILDAVGRGKELTQRLLAFARQQPLLPEPTDIGERVAHTKTLMARTLGEKFEVHVECADDLWPALVDPGQFENSLINLLINSRDAMPRGGKIVIVGKNAQLSGENRVNFPLLSNGDYVVLSVEDNGTGMTFETAEHAFDPFYSTKEPGRGSGLGLSMVYGFARQSGGDAFIESKVGVGTKLSIYFPRSMQESRAKPDPSYVVSPRGRGRNILVIEDEPAVREITLRMLAILGYNASAVADGPQALKVLSEENDFSLVLSDVVLPGKLNGPDIAKKLREDGIKTKFVFMSGYLADAITDPAIVEGNAPFLAKPFKLAELEHALNDSFAERIAIDQVDGQTTEPNAIVGAD